MIVVHLINSLYGGGMERRFRLLVGDNDQNQVIYVKSGDYETSNEFKRSQLYQIPMKSSYDVLFLFKVLKLIRKIKPDIIQSWSLQMNVIGFLVSTITSLPHIMIEPNSPQADLEFEKYSIKHFLKKLCALKAIVISNSREGKKYWKHIAKKSVLVRNGVPFNLTSIDSELPCDLTFDKYFLVVSRLNSTSKHKNINFVIRTFSSFVSNYPDYKMIVCGSGNMDHSYKSLVVDLGIKDRVIFVGLRDSKTVLHLMKKAIALISMSSHEGMPNILLEAASVRCPLIISNIPAHTQFLREKSALFVNLFDTKSLQSAMRSLVTKKYGETNMSMNAFNDIRYFTVDQMRKNFQRLYNVIKKR